MQIEDLRLHASVVSREGHKLGTLSRFVFRKSDFKLTHIVIDTGILRSGEPLWKGGWGLSHDRVVPLGALDSASSHEIRLTMTADDFRDHSRDYIEEYFAPIPDLQKGEPDSSDLWRFAASIPGEPGPYMLLQDIAMPPGAEDITKDSPVWRLNPHQKIGEVERVLFDEDTGKITALVVRRGFLFSKDVVLPAERVVEVVGDIVRVELTDDELAGLVEHQPAD